MTEPNSKSHIEFTYEQYAAFVKATQAAALHQAAEAAVSDGDDCVPWDADHDRATVAVWLQDRADRIVVDL